MGGNDGLGASMDASTDTGEEKASAPIRIGLVDNDPYAVKVLQTMIERMASDFQVVWTCDLGAVAISRCLNPAKRPDVLVTDMSMGDVSGTEVCRAIRAKTPEVGLVGVTSYSLASFRDEAVRTPFPYVSDGTKSSGLSCNCLTGIGPQRGFVPCREHGLFAHDWPPLTGRCREANSGAVCRQRASRQASQQVVRVARP